MTEPVGVGVIGAGYWGRKLIQEYLSSERSSGNVRLIKICDSSLSALLDCEQKLSINHNQLTRRVKDVIDDNKISAVHIAAPNHTHYSLAKMALEAGKDVLVEKPMTLNSSEAYELVDLAESRKRVLHVGHIFRFNSALQSAHRLLKTGTVGRVFYLRIQWTDSCYFPDRDIIFDLGPHPIDILNHLLDSWPEQLSGFTRGYRSSPDHEEVTYAIAEYPHDVFAHIELSWLHPKKTREVTVVGSEATLVIDCLKQRLARFSNGNTQDIPVSVNNTIESEIAHFARCVAQHSTSRESGLIGARTVEALEAIRRSMQERLIPVPRPFGPDRTSALIAVLETASNGLKNLTESQENGGNEIKNYVEILMKQGLLRGVATQEGLSYEVTDAGSQFLKEYQNMMRDLKGTFSRIRAPLPVGPTDHPPEHKAKDTLQS